MGQAVDFSSFAVSFLIYEIPANLSVPKRVKVELKKTRRITGPLFRYDSSNKK